MDNFNDPAVSLLSVRAAAEWMRKAICDLISDCFLLCNGFTFGGTQMKRTEMAALPSARQGHESIDRPLTPPRVRPLAVNLQGAGLTFRILETMVDHGAPLGVTRLANLLGLSKPRAHRYLTAMLEAGYVERTAGSGYALGVKLYLLGHKASKNDDLIYASEMPIKDLRDRFNQTVTVARPVGEDVVVVATAVGRGPLEIISRVGARYDHHVAAHGKMALAFDDAGLDRVVAGEMRRWTSRSIIDGPVLHDAVKIARERGWAASPEEAVLGINALAVPIFDRDGKSPGSVALVGSIQYVPDPPRPEHLSALWMTAAMISAKLGCETYPYDNNSHTVSEGASI